MGAGFLLLPWCHDFHILELKHPLLQNIHPILAQFTTTSCTATAPGEKTRVKQKNSYRRDALGEEELLERQPHELAVHEEVEGLRLVVRFGCASGASEGLEIRGSYSSMDGWESDVGCSPAARRLLTISERPMRERSAGTAMVAGGARSGGGSLVTKRTRTWREGSASMAAAADGVEVVVVGVAAAGRIGEWFWEFELWTLLVRVSEMLAPFHRDDGEGQRYCGLGVQIFR